MKKVQRQNKPQIICSQYQDHEPILCDGCDRHIDENNYIQHWEACIAVKREEMRVIKLARKQAQKRQQQARERQKQMKRRQKQNQIILEEERLRQLYGVRCPRCGIEIEGGVRFVQKHKYECTQRQIQCEYCYEQFPPSLMQDHYNQCQMKKAIEISMRDCSTVQQTSNQRRSTRRTNSSRNIGGVSNNRNINAIASTPFYYNGQMTTLGSVAAECNLSIEQLLQLMQEQPNSQINQQFQETFAQSDRSVQNSNADLLEEYFKALRKKDKFTEEQFKALKRVTFKGEPADEKCSICQELFEKQSVLIILQCSHLFHEQCLHDWLKKAATCPNCNKKLKGK